MGSDRQRLTGRGEPAGEDAPAPTAERLADGQHADHWVLSEEERAKGFVRPVRTSYRHVGVRPTYPLRDLTTGELRRHAAQGYVKFEQYPPSESPRMGRYWTQAQLESGCGAVTTMPRAIAETYARSPMFYGSTFCVGCRDYFPVAQFVWDDDGTTLGT